MPLQQPECCDPRSASVRSPGMQRGKMGTLSALCCDRAFRKSTLWLASGTANPQAPASHPTGKSLGWPTEQGTDVFPGGEGCAGGPIGDRGTGSRHPRTALCHDRRACGGSVQRRCDCCDHRAQDHCHNSQIRRTKPSKITRQGSANPAWNGTCTE